VILRRRRILRARRRQHGEGKKCRGEAWRGKPNGHVCSLYLLPASSGTAPITA
jgi:hypothetical protein